MRPFALKTRRHKCFPRPEISGSCVTNTIFRVDLKSLCGAGARVRRDSRRRRDPQSKRLDADAFRPALRVRARRGAATPPPRPTRSLTTLPAALPVCSSPRGPVSQKPNHAIIHSVLSEYFEGLGFRKNCAGASHF